MLDLDLDSGTPCTFTIHMLEHIFLAAYQYRSDGLKYFFAAHYI